MTTVEVLRAARQKIALGWCQHAYAKNAADVTVLPREPGAVRWCAMGALRAVGDGDTVSPQVALEHVIGWYGGLSGWNDVLGRTQAEVLAAFDAAIVKLEAEL